MTNTNKNNGCFIFKGKRYIKGTVVKFKKEWLEKNGYSTRHEFRNTISYNYPKIVYDNFIYGRFLCGVNKDCFLMFKSDYDAKNNKSPYRFWEEFNKKETEDAIEEIIIPNEWIVHTNDGSNMREVIVGRVIYIMLMIFAILFNQSIYIWIYLTILWVFVKQIIINKVNDKT